MVGSAERVKNEKRKVKSEIFELENYTMREHLDEFGLINMNGRAYDPLNGRFLNPDKVLQDPYGSQSYNPYSYCLNNPLKYTDPSGWVSRNWGVGLNWMNLMFMMNRNITEERGRWLSANMGLSKGNWFDWQDIVMQAVLAETNGGSNGGGGLTPGPKGEGPGLFDGGLKSGPNSTNVSSNLKYYISGLTALLLSSVNLKSPDQYFEGVAVYYCEFPNLRMGAAFTVPGIGIFISNLYKDDIGTMRHEYGHVLQAARWGIEFYWTKVVPASIESYFKDGINGFNHMDTWCEWSANKLSYNLLGSPNDWEFGRFPIFFENIRFGNWNPYADGIGDFMINWLGSQIHGGGGSW